LPVNYLPTGAIEQRIVMRYAYDMLGNRIHQFSMEAGARWMLGDVAGKPIRAWDSRGHNFTTKYDALRRPIEQTVRGTFSDPDPLKPNSDPRTLNRDILVDKIEYGEGIANAEALNLRTRIYQHFDSSGVATNARLDANGNPTEAYDFKGNLLHSTRRLARDYTTVPDWLLPAEPQLEAEFFEGSTRYDALNRPIQSIVPHSSLTRPGHPNKFNVIQPVFNEANLLERVDVWLERGAEPSGLLDPANEAPSPVGVADIDYDAKGQRTLIDYKTRDETVIRTTYAYDRKTFRLTHLYTRRGVDPNTAQGVAFTEDCDNPTPPPPPTITAPEIPPEGKSCGLQNLHYTYDPAGNITHIQDDAQQTIYFKKRVEPSNDYFYDALYRLIQASGREHLGQSGEPLPHSHDDGGRTARQHPNDGKAMGCYIERYVYDAVGNPLQMRHIGSDPAHAGWRRNYDYLELSLIEDGSGGAPAKFSNRLTSTTLHPNSASPHVETYLNDAHGNMVRMQHLGGGLPEPNMHWDYKDQLRQTDLGVGGVAFYVYDASGQRVRKVWEKAPGLTEERIYLGGFEIFRKHAGPIGANTAALERETLHVMDDKQRFALVETRTLDTGSNDQAPRQLIRYQFGNHLGSASLELDERAQIISYEEYAPYGSSTYQAVRSQTETAKRYRYTGKERDEESGLYYHGARYYAPWLGRWVSCDPLSTVDGFNLYRYSRDNPIQLMDPSGNDPIDPTQPPEPQGFGLTLQGNRLRVGPLTPYPASACDELDPLCSGLQFSFQSKQSVPRGELFILGGGYRYSPLTLPESSSSETEKAPVPGTLRATAQELARPQSKTGVRPRGTLHLWSGEGAKVEAKAAIESSKSGWMMGNIEGAPTPEHAAAEAEFKEALARAPGGRLTQAEFERIWGPRSASVVGRGAFAGHPVESHGTPASTTIQSRYELPARAIGGGLAGGLFFGTGMYTAITGGQDPNLAVSMSLVLSGVGEATSGIIYGSGALLGSAEAMGIGMAGGTLFGGAGAAVGFGVASVRSFERGDIAGGIVNALGAIGGALMIASLFTPIGWVGLLGLGLVAFAAGFNLGRWFSEK